MGRRVPLRALAFALGLALIVSGIVLARYDAHGALLTLEIVAPLGAVTVLAGELLATHRRGGLRRQFGAVAALGALALAVGVALFVVLMFVSSHDALMTVLLSAYAAALVLWLSRRLGGSRWPISTAWGRRWPRSATGAVTSGPAFRATTRSPASAARSTR